MSNNIYDILKKFNNLDSVKMLTEGKKACKDCGQVKCECLEESKGSKPDFLDMDKDGDTEEPMKKAAKEKSKGAIAEAVARVEQQLAEKYMGFKKTVAAIKKGGSAEDPEAVAAAIGRKKYGKAKFQKAAAAGKKLGEDQDMAEARDSDTNFGSTVTRGSWVVYDGSTVKRFKSREGAKAYAEKNGGKVASSEFYADKIQKQGVEEALTSSASEKEIIDDMYNEWISSEYAPMDDESGNDRAVISKAQNFLFGKVPEHDLERWSEELANRFHGVSEGKTWAKHNNLRAGGMSKKSVKEMAGGMGAGSVATSMGGGNGFVNGGPGTISRTKLKKKK